jgi:hypothetical protein
MTLPQGDIAALKLKMSRNELGYEEGDEEFK